MIKTISVKNLSEFHARFAKINNKLLKYGKGLEVLSMKEWMKVSEEGRKATPMLDIELSGPEILHNGKSVTYIGMITLKDGVRVIFNNGTTNINLGEVKDENLTCDHCKSDRRRVKYFFFLDEGKVVSIGSSCAVDYFGMDIERYLDVYTSSMNDLDHDGWSTGGQPLDSFEKTLVATAAATDIFKMFWISKDKADIKNMLPTSQVIKNFLNPPRNQFGEEIKKDMEKIEAILTPQMDALKIKIIERWSIKPSSDFEWNIVNNLFYHAENGKRELREYIVSPGIVGYAIYAALATPVATDVVKSEWVGNPGDKIEATIRIIDSKEISTRFGYSTLLVMLDTENRKFKTFTTSVASGWEVGQTFKIKATVKDHTEYNGTKETMLKLMKEIK